MPFIGFILILMGLFAVGGTLYMVMREHQETEEWYIPPKPATDSAASIPSAKPEPAVTAPPTTSAVSTPVPTPPPATASPDVAPSADKPAE